MSSNYLGLGSQTLITQGTFFSNYSTISNSVTIDTNIGNGILIGPITVSGASTTLTISGDGTFTIL